MSFLDTLRAAFKGGGGERVPLARSFTSPWSWAFEPAGARPPFEYRHAVRHAFLENPVAQRAVRIVAEGVGSAPLLPTDANALVAATSAGQSLLETLAAQLLLHGNGYVQVMRDGASQPVELFALRPERVSVVAGADGWPAAYQYKVGDKALTIPVEDEGGWPQVIHLKAYHPADDQKAFFVNEAHALTDVLLHPAIEGEANNPPAVPAEGETWLVGNTPTGAWADRAGELASLQAGTWVFVTPRDGIRVLDKSTGQEIRYVGGWQRPVAPAAPSGGVTVDAEARTAIAELVAALADGGFFAAP